MHGETRSQSERNGGPVVLANPLLRTNQGYKWATAVPSEGSVPTTVLGNLPIGTTLYRFRGFDTWLSST